MPLYELGVIIDPEIPPEEETATLERLEGIIALEPLNFEMRTNDAVIRSLVLNMDRELRRKRKMDAKYEARAAKKAAKAAAKAESAADED
jgi:ribosomal protein S6